MPTLIQPKTTTAAELYSFPADGYRYELLAGALSMMSPAGGRHGRVALQIAHLLKTHADRTQLGVVFAAETGFLIETDPDTVLAPDVAFVSRAVFERIEDETSYLPVAPELVVEVLPPSDRFSRTETKAFTWLDAGSKLVLLVDPQAETIHAYRSRKHIQVYERTETLDCSDAVKAWKLKVSNAFQRH